jgi:hypothetical protein
MISIAILRRAESRLFSEENYIRIIWIQRHETESGKDKVKKFEVLPPVRFERTHLSIAQFSFEELKCAALNHSAMVACLRQKSMKYLKQLKTLHNTHNAYSTNHVSDGRWEISRISNRKYITLA